VPSPAAQEATKPRRWDWQAVLVLLAGAVFAALLGLDLGGRELWTDEFFSLDSGLRPFAVGLWDPFHPPGYYLLLHGWLGFGASDGWLRAFSVVWALVAWALAWLIAGELGLRREGVVAAWLMALSPLLVLYFRLGRYFSMAAALVLLAVYALLRLRRRPSPGNALLLALSVAAVGYTDYAALAVVLLTIVVFAISAGARARAARRWILAATGAALLAMAPIFLRLLRDTGTVAGIVADPLARSLWGVAAKLALPVFGLATGECLDPWRFAVTVPAVLVTGLLLAAGIASLWRDGGLRRATAVLFPLNVVAAVALTGVAASEPANRITSLAMGTVPLAYLTMARGALRLGRTWRTVTALGLMACLYGYGLHNYFAREQLLNPGYAPPWREVAAAVQARERSGDTILVRDDAFARYYPGRARIAPIPELARVAEGQAAPTGRVWLIGRDRGAQDLLDETEIIRSRLLAHGFRERVFAIQPRTPQEQRWRTAILRRPAWDAYVKVYLFTPGTPPNPG
jgi:mannosyltransferase